MKSRVTTPARLFALAMLVSAVQTASAFYDPSTQRWINRDPIGEADEINLYGFVSNSPISHNDPVGLFITGCSRGPCADPCGDAKKAGLDRGDWAGVVCCGGQKRSCVWQPGGAFGAGNKKAKTIIDKCIEAHEDTHHDDIDCPSGPGVTRPDWKSGKNKKNEECTGHKAMLQCLKSSMSGCTGDPQCIKQVLAEMKLVKAAVELYCGS